MVGKKLFNLAEDEGDLSDEEVGEQRAYKEQERPVREHSDRGHEMGQTRVREQEKEKEKAERVRRYHALMELLTTEVGYLLDLRALVTVCRRPQSSPRTFTTDFLAGVPRPSLLAARYTRTCGPLTAAHISTWNTIKCWCITALSSTID